MFIEHRVMMRRIATGVSRLVRMRHPVRRSLGRRNGLHAAGVRGLSTRPEPSDGIDNVPIASSDSLPRIDPSELDQRAEIDMHKIITEMETSNQFGKSELWERFLPIEQVMGIMTNMQESTGLPWLATIPLLAVGTRLAMLPMSIWQMKYIHGRLGGAQGLLLQMRIKVAEMKKRGATPIELANAHVRDMLQVFNITGFSPFVAVTMALVPIPFFITSIVATRHIVFSGEEFQRAGAAWFENLQIPDPYVILPATACGLTILSLELGIRARASAAAAGASVSSGPHSKDEHSGGMSVVHYFLHGIQMFILVMFNVWIHLPAGVFPFWITSAAFSLCQNRAYQTATVRRWIGIDRPAPFTAEMEQRMLKSGMWTRSGPIREQPGVPSGGVIDAMAEGPSAGSSKQSKNNQTTVFRAGSGPTLASLQAGTAGTGRRNKRRDKWAKRESERQRSRRASMKQPEPSGGAGVAAGKDVDTGPSLRDSGAARRQK